ncbi:MAG: class I SAM-dependent methyltransferase [Cytophagales bacterium]|nr:class I SAM-dependent methyltransferase [Cytophagales bacterium]
MNTADINNEIGDIDLFLLDLILKGKVTNGMKILDAGCGSGRNLFYFLRQGFDVKGIDTNESEVKAANFLSRSLGRGDVCSQSSLISLPFDSDSFDFIVCSRVLHFAESPAQFSEMLNEMARVLTPVGLLYLSMDSMIGMEKSVKKNDDSTHQFPDGSIRFMLTENEVAEINKNWSHFIDPRTINYNSRHAETTLVLSPISHEQLGADRKPSK